MIVGGWGWGGDTNIVCQTEETVRRGKKVHTHFMETGVKGQTRIRAKTIRIQKVSGAETCRGPW